MPASSEAEVFKLIASRLEAAGIAYMVTGSFAAAFYAQPRTTRDLDVVVDLSVGDAKTIEELFGGEFILDREEIRRSIAARGMFNLIHESAITKVDFIVRKDEEYRQTEFQRRRRSQFEGQPVWVVAPEDLILSKLAWGRDGGSELQRRDVRQLFASGVALDEAYLEEWARRLGLEGELREARQP